METMYKADRLYNEMMEVDQKIKALEVKDEQSITEYFRLYEELIYNHKWIGSVYESMRTMQSCIAKTVTCTMVHMQSCRKRSSS